MIIKKILSCMTLDNSMKVCKHYTNEQKYVIYFFVLYHKYFSLHWRSSYIIFKSGRIIINNKVHPLNIQCNHISKTWTQNLKRYKISIMMKKETKGTKIMSLNPFTKKLYIGMHINFILLSNNKLLLL